MKLLTKSLFYFVLICCFSKALAQEGNLSMSQYQLGSGDKISITVFGQEDLSMEIRLPDVGTINYPFLGEIKIVGLTTAEVEALIYNGLKGDYLVEPSVLVTFLVVTGFSHTSVTTENLLLVCTYIIMFQLSAEGMELYRSWRGFRTPELLRAAAITWLLSLLGTFALGFLFP